MPARQTRSKALWSALLEQLLLLLVLLAVEWTQSTKDAIEMMCSSPRTKPRQFGHWLLDWARGSKGGSRGREAETRDDVSSVKNNSKKKSKFEGSEKLSRLIRSPFQTQTC